MASAVYDSLLKMDDKGVAKPYLAQSMDTPPTAAPPGS